MVEADGFNAGEFSSRGYGKWAGYPMVAGERLLGHERWVLC
jgi:hypothetical protein